VRLRTEFGEYPILITALHIVVRWTMLFLGNSFNILPVIIWWSGLIIYGNLTKRGPNNSIRGIKEEFEIIF
jgi:hypothetical protein